MFTSKRQEWILRMIKGPDIVPVDNCPGRYASRGTICITVDESSVTIRPTDVLDLSDTRFLVVHGNDRACQIPWERISNLEFDEQALQAASSRPRTHPARHSIMPFPIGKKVV
jgi:hypothetical protein